MPRKKYTVELDVLNRLIQAKNKATSMPDNIWEGQNNQPPQWILNLAQENIGSLVNQEVQNAKDKMASTVGEGRYEEMIALLRESLELRFDESKQTVVVLLVMDDEKPENNVSQHVHCEDGTGFAGYVFDCPKDAYLVECVEHIPLGVIPVAAIASLPKTGGWKTVVPFSEKMVEVMIPSYYRRILKTTREKYPKPKYSFQYMQMLGCN